ncbi:MAG: glycerol-3-phosphate dehydrogenase/oxidase [Renibacterium sp.]|nr:glycerol-3-phosphate dehydrogenase/oxidase [Renibacterium sp.]
MSWINERSRAASLASIQEQEVDLLVIGGGITGAGVALDAASRGLSVALLESQDLASGTSGFSSKLIHGGLRYLAKADVGVAWESALERRWLMEFIAPHLVRPLGYLVAEAKASPRWEFWAAGFGVLLADGMRRLSGLSGQYLPPPQRLTAAAAHRLAPEADPDRMRSALLYWDGQLEDDARLVIAVARTAVKHGAHVLTGLKAIAATDRTVTALDERTGGLLNLRAGSVVNATGVWAGQLEGSLDVLPSRGSHLVVAAERLGNPRAAWTAPVPGHFGRYVFALPQSNGQVYLGLTDELDRGADGHATAVPESDVEFLLETVNRTLAEPLLPTDVLGRFAGLRPLISKSGDGAPGQSADVSRRHVLLDLPGRPITIAGGKLTTYRKMAEDAVDSVLRRLGREATCVTRKLALVGAAPAAELAALGAPLRLVHRYGSEARLVESLSRIEPMLAEEVATGSGVTGAELFFGVVAEGASSVPDLLARRSRLAFVPELAAAATERAGEVLDAANQWLAQRGSPGPDEGFGPGALAGSG